MKYKINKKIIIFGLAIIFVFASGNFCFADDRGLEIDYPVIDGLEIPATVKTPFPEYIKYIFHFALMVSGLIAFASIIYGGFRYLTSADSPSVAGEARSRISGGILGVIILLSSYLILTTFDPQLVILKTPGINPVSTSTMPALTGDVLLWETKNYDGDPRDALSLNEIGHPPYKVGSLKVTEPTVALAIYEGGGLSGQKACLKKEDDWRDLDVFKNSTIYEGFSPLSMKVIPVADCPTKNTVFPAMGELTDTVLLFAKTNREGRVIFSFASDDYGSSSGPPVAIHSAEIEDGLALWFFEKPNYDMNGKSICFKNSFDDISTRSPFDVTLWFWRTSWANHIGSVLITSAANCIHPNDTQGP